VEEICGARVVRAQTQPGGFSPGAAETHGELFTPPATSVAWSAMSKPMSLLVTLTGRDRPGVTSRLFGELSAYELAVLDVEQVVIRGRLILGVLLACGDAPNLTAIHRQVSALAADLGMDAEITLGSGDQAPPRRCGLHVTVLGSPLLPDVVAAIA